MLALLLAVACGGSSASDPNPTASMTGTWIFTASSQSFGSIVSGTANIQQTGDTITGQATLVGTPCANSASISGTVSGKYVSLQLNENGDIVTITGTMDSAYTYAYGNYSASLGCTDGDQGTWTMSKQ